MKLFGKKNVKKQNNAVCIYGPPEMLEKYRNKSQNDDKDNKDDRTENKDNADKIDGEEQQ